MKYVRSGLILFCANFKECLKFYRESLELPTLFTDEDGKEPLCCFDLGGSYLMVEYSVDAKPNGNKLRLHVENVESLEQQLNAKHVDYKKRVAPWGTTIEVRDPAGNIISLRDEETFAKRIKGNG